MFNSDKLGKILKYFVYISAFMPLIIFSEFMSPFHFGKVTIFRVAVEVMAVIYVMLVLKDRSFLPKLNNLFWTVTLFMLTFGLATLTSVIPYQSFWGTLERMGGLFSFIHFWAFFVISAAVMREKENWITFVKLSIFTSLLSSLYGFLQKTDLEWVIGSGGRSKIFGTIGNPALFAGYIIVNLFLALMMAFRKQTTRVWRNVSIWIVILNALAVYLTGVRGSALAVVISLPLFGFLYAINFGSAKVRKATISFLVLIFMITAGLFMLRDTDFVKTNQYLSRYSDISPTTFTVKTRFWAWRAGFQGLADSFKYVIVGYGPENFNVPFSKHFYPKFFRGIGSETLFDRAHNQFLEVLFTMGVIGFAAYLSIFYFAFKNLRPKNIPASLDKNESIVLRIGLLTTLVAYMIHNAFIFDSSANFLVFFLVLGFINFLNLRQSAELQKSPQASKVDVRPLVRSKVLPLAIGGGLGIFVLILAYYTAVLPTKANFATTRAIVESWNSRHDIAVEKFKVALSYDTFGKYEIRHRYAQYALERNNNRKLDEKITSQLVLAAEGALRNAQEFPDDYLPYLYASRAYILLGRESPKSEFNELALENSRKALELAPTFVRTYYEVAQAYLNQKNYSKAIANFQKAVDLNPDVSLSWWYLGVTLFESGDQPGGIQTIRIAINRGHEYYHSETDLLRVIKIFFSVKDFEMVAIAYEYLLKIQPENPQYHASLAVAYSEIGEIDKAVIEAKAAAKIDPTFEAEARAFVGSRGRAW